MLRLGDTLRRAMEITTDEVHVERLLNSQRQGALRVTPDGIRFTGTLRRLAPDGREVSTQPLDETYKLSPEIR